MGDERFLCVLCGRMATVEPWRRKKRRVAAAAVFSRTRIVGSKLRRLVFHIDAIDELVNAL